MMGISWATPMRRVAPNHCRCEPITPAVCAERASYKREKRNDKVNIRRGLSLVAVGKYVCENIAVLRFNSHISQTCIVYERVYLLEMRKQFKHVNRPFPIFFLHNLIICGNDPNPIPICYRYV